jgi:hypothetical protein
MSTEERFGAAIHRLFTEAREDMDKVLRMLATHDREEKREENS